MLAACCVERSLLSRPILRVYSAGTVNYGAACFIFSYIVIVVWILLQVSVAVLLVLPPHFFPSAGSKSIRTGGCD